MTIRIEVGQTGTDRIADAARVELVLAIFDAADNAAGAEKHAAQRRPVCRTRYPQDRSYPVLRCNRIAARPARHARHCRVEPAAQTDVVGIDIGGAAGQQDDRGQGAKGAALEQGREHLRGGAVAAVDGQYLYTLGGKRV
jgi:hypothetical protein